MTETKMMPCPEITEELRNAALEAWIGGPTVMDGVDAVLRVAIAAWNKRADTGGGESELEALRKFAHEATIAITGLTGGGSEFFGKRVGDIYLADLPFCVKQIRETREGLFDAMKEAKREARDARSKAEPQS
jgi:hypothetical protein